MLTHIPGLKHGFSQRKGIEMRIKSLLKLLFVLISFGICSPLLAQRTVEEKQPRATNALLQDIEIYQIDQSCGQDRRCRIGKLRDKLRTRRVLEAKLEDEQLFKLMQRYESRRRSIYPRLENNLSLNYMSDINFSFTIPLSGINLLYHIDEHWQIDANYLAAIDAFDIYTAASGYYFNEMYQIRAGINYMNDLTPFSSYYGLAFAYSYMEDSFSGSGAVESPAHVIYLNYGWDWQFVTGFHMRLGFYYAVPMYIGLRYAGNKENITDVDRNAVIEKISTAIYGLGLCFQLGFSF
jgi:hypothetical protein